MAKSSSHEIVAGLDIGSSSVRVAVGQRSASAGGRESIQIIGASEAPSVGVNKGVITSIEDAISSVSTCLEKVERMTGVQIERAFVGISGSHVVSQESKGVVAVSRSDGEIREEDVERALEAARTVATPLNYEILHVLPKSFIVDGQSGIKDPVGMTGIRLEVDAQIIQSLSSQLKNLSKCVYRTGIEIDDVVLGILAASEAVASPRQKELGVVVANIGSSTTSLAVYEDGDVLRTVVLPIGSDHITSDVAIGLRTSIEVAERVKIEHGIASSREAKREDIRLADLGSEEDEVVSKKFVAEIIEARVEEIFGKIDKELKKIHRSRKLPGGVVLVGGTARMPGIAAFAKEKLQLAARIGNLQPLGGLVDTVQSPEYMAAVGLMQLDMLLTPTGHPVAGEPSSNVFGMLDGILKRFKR